MSRNKLWETHERSFKELVRSISDVQVEIGFLAHLIGNPEAIYSVCDLVHPSDFVSAINGSVYRVLVDLATHEDNFSFDRTVIEHLLSPWPDPSINQNDYFDTIQLLSPEQIERGFNFYVQTLYGLSVRRKVALDLKNMETAILSKSRSAEETLALVDQALYRTLSAYQSHETPRPITDRFSEFLEGDDSKYWRITSGFDLYDDAIGGGLFPGSFHVIMGRAKEGKSAFLLNSTISILKRDPVPILYLDTELTFEMQQIRWSANQAEVDAKHLQVGTFRNDPGEYAKVVSAYNSGEGIFSRYFHLLSVPGKTVDELIAVIRRWWLQHVRDKVENNRCLVIYDYLKLAEREMSNSVQEYQALGYKLQRFHDFAAQYKIPILSAVQVNREGIVRKGQKASVRLVDSEATIAMSDRISWFADSVSVFRRKFDEELQRDNQFSYNGNYLLCALRVRSGEGHSPIVEVADGLYENEHINFDFQRHFMKLTQLNLHSQVIDQLRNRGWTDGHGNRDEVVD